MAPPATPTRTPADLDGQAARLREYAAGLSRRQADRDEQDGTDFGARIDDAKRSATAARSAAETATAQATELHDKAKESLALAKQLEADAARFEADGSPAGRMVADDFHDQAQMCRSSAIADTRRAERAEQVARQQSEEAERHERSALQTERARSDRMDANDALRHTANQLEAKADALEAAATDLRRAADAWEPVERDALTGLAAEHQARADRITPDFSRLSTEDVVAAGIPVSEVPGAELMDPRAFADPVAPSAVDVHDTDLMDPSSFADPVVPAGPGADHVHEQDSDLMDPGTDPVLGPRSSHLDGYPATATGPDSRAWLAGEAGGALDGGPDDPLVQAGGDLAADADPLGSEPRAAGGDLAPLDDAVASTSAPAGGEAGMDPPALDSAGSDTDSYGDAYDDVTDDMSGEYA